MAWSEEAKSLISATTNADKIAKDEFTRVMKDSKSINKQLKREYKRIANRPILKQRVAQLYVCGFYSISQIASILTVSSSTVKSLLKDEEVMDMILSYQEEEKTVIDTRIKALRSKATETLSELLDSDDDSIRLQATKDILDRSGHTIKKDQNINVNISYEQQLQNLMEGVDFVEVND